MALRPVATSSVRANSHLNRFNVQDAEYYVRSCNLLDFYNLWFCVKLRCANSVLTKQISQNLRHCLQMTGSLFNQTCLASKIELSMWKLQEINILLLRGMHDWRFLSCNGDSKSQYSIRAAEYFWPLSMLNGVDSVRIIETGLKCGQWMLRKLRNTVHAAGWQEESRLGNRRRRFAQLNDFDLCISWWVLSRSGKSKRDWNAISGCWENWKILSQVLIVLCCCMRTVFLSFLDNHWPLSSPVSIFRTYVTPINLCKGREHSAAQIGDGDFRGGLLLPLLSGSRMTFVFRGFLGNRWPLSSPVSIFRTDSTLIALCKGRKHSAPRIGDDDFQGGSPLPMLCMSTVFLSFLDNHRPLSSPVSIFLTDSTPSSLCKGREHSAARIGHRDFHGRSPREWAQ
jgi:hypothetical protein